MVSWKRWVERVGERGEGGDVWVGMFEGDGLGSKRNETERERSVRATKEEDRKE